jgi:molybdopterin synthase sulfur carrier subunit
MITIVFFAALREQLGCAQLNLAIDTPSTVLEVKQHLINEHQHWQKILQHESILSAVNHTVVGSEFVLKSGDEVAFFPPVTGG